MDLFDIKLRLGLSTNHSGRNESTALNVYILRILKAVKGPILPEANRLHSNHLNSAFQGQRFHLHYNVIQLCFLHNDILTENIEVEIFERLKIFALENSGLILACGFPDFWLSCARFYAGKSTFL